MMSLSRLKDLPPWQGLALIVMQSVTLPMGIALILICRPPSDGETDANKHGDCCIIPPIYLLTVPSKLDKPKSNIKEVGGGGDKSTNLAGSHSQDCLIWIDILIWREHNSDKKERDVSKWFGYQYVLDCPMIQSTTGFLSFLCWKLGSLFYWQLSLIP